MITLKHSHAAPILADPGFGRTWRSYEFWVTGRVRRWHVTLYSRTGSTLGYVADYDNGWGANVATARGFKSAGHDGYRTAQAAADALLKERAKR